MRNAKPARTVLGMVASLTMLASLSAYGVRAYYTQDEPLQGTARQAVSIQEEFDRVIIERERVIVSQLGLSADQQRQYDSLRAQQKEITHVYRTRRPHRPEEGMELNAWWNNSVRGVFTANQYNHYLRLWSSGPSSVATPGVAKVSVPVANNDNQILAPSSVTAPQSRQVGIHRSSAASSVEASYNPLTVPRY